MVSAAPQRLHLLGIRHHGPGSAALLRQALDALDPACVLIEGPPEADALIPFIAEPGMVPPLAMLLYAADNASQSFFMPFAEFSPEWQAMHWALAHQRPVRFIDWPAAISLAFSQRLKDDSATPDEPRPDALDLLAAAAGYDDGESFWNGLIEQSGAQTQQALTVFAAIEAAMTEARAHEETFALSHSDQQRDLLREAFMRTSIRAALKQHTGLVAVVCGAWHLSALRAEVKPADDKSLIQSATTDLPRIKVEATWVPWTDGRLSARSGYRAGVISPGWYRHLWSLYAQSPPDHSHPDQAHPDHSHPHQAHPHQARIPDAAEFAALWQARTVQTLREEGVATSTASAIDATRLALGLAAMRGLPMPGLAEMREAALATLCHGNPIPFTLIERKLYIGERVGRIGDTVPQMPLARDLALWQRRTRLKPEDLELEVRLDLRSEAGLLKSTLLQRLNLISVPWGKLVDAQAGRGTFREVWTIRWVPELSVALAEALIYGVTIEQAAANSTQERARASTSITVLSDLVHQALIADLPDAATACIDLLQAAAVHAADMTDLMQAVAPLVRVLRYGSARQLPEDALRTLIHSLAVEVNAGIRMGSHSLDQDTARARIAAIEVYDEALTLFSDEALTTSWRGQLAAIVDDDQVVPPVAGLSLRRLHDARTWPLQAVATAFARHTHGRTPQHAGAFLEGFLRGGSEIILHDEPLLQLIDSWLCALAEDDFIESLPLLRRSLTGFDSVSRRRLLDKLKRGPQQTVAAHPPQTENPAFAAALPLLYKILGIQAAGGDPA